MCLCTESVQQSLEKKFGKAGGSIPITPSDLFEKRMGVSIHLIAGFFSLYIISLLFRGLCYQGQGEGHCSVSS